jgi:SAM-dependent methyltransferase
VPWSTPAPDGMPRPPVDYDAELRLHNQVLRRACGVRRHDHVLDVGCGTGQTTRQAARTATAGSALGVDLSAPMIDRARELAQAQGLRNVTFERADAQVHRFPPEQFDLAISRFGTMFFDDPAAALGWVRGFTRTDRVLKRLDPAGAERALQRLRETLAAHAGEDGIWFDSRAWIVTARRR